jgi:hypothetical protein
MFLLWGTDKAVDLSWVLNKDRTIDNIQNYDSYINMPSSQLARNAGVMRFLWGTDKAVELGWVLNKR